MDPDPHMGYRFHRNKKQIISDLEEKMHNRNINFPMIGEVDDMCNYEPWELSGFLQRTGPNDQVWYFFNPIPDGANMRRTTNGGYWQVTGNPVVIYDDEEERIGEKRYLVYHFGHGHEASRTDWIIHEFHSVNELSFQDPFVLCRLKDKSDQ